ncbi:DUF488 domain-containing protein [Croceicoccus naphthovorans]|uniref:Uncharacterized protein n=1 Tax=Croceicoccus naphthovorans TaxID=1348774 RepID=A0A0G3XGR9_9SPHN|nr:DUF488 domain-containing protein [Croceicoccus naphthovorans]AKM10402.1 hypothetical protein AB433_11225 [Croceicoccus naphthovorans]MBB3990102.1 uncharacterized protein (DUF488 family) [Croceicoccus naphthovorans]
MASAKTESATADSRTIWTIGYERATVPAVIDALADAGIEVLVDVRALPLSRRPGFSKTALAGAAMEAGIGYRHLKPLGTPKEGREAARSGDYARLAKIYGGQLELPEALAAAAELRDLAAERRVALLCFCGDAGQCHRSLLLGAMLGDFKAVHLHPAMA